MLYVSEHHNFLVIISRKDIIRFIFMCFLQHTGLFSVYAITALGVQTKLMNSLLHLYEGKLFDARTLATLSVLCSQYLF